jgi:glycosyltransferase involved in cell wall biosynthesis
LLGISVVVSTYSEKKLESVIECLDSLIRQTFQPAEIILALDKNEALIEFYKARMPLGVKLVVSDGFGLSRARNAGVKNACGDVIAFIDDDAVADKRWLENLVNNYGDPRVSGVGGLIWPRWEGKRPSWFPEELYWVVGCSYKGLPEKKSTVRNLIGCNMSFRKSVFEKVGYFHEGMGRVGSKLTGHEDTEFAIRLSRTVPDCAVIYDPDAIVYHRVAPSRANMKYLAKRSFAEGYSKAIFSNKEVAPSGTMKVEKSYLKQLFSKSIPQRLIRAHRLENISQAVTLLFSTWLVSIGYFSGCKLASTYVPVTKSADHPRSHDHSHNRSNHENRREHSG